MNDTSLKLIDEMFTNFASDAIYKVSRLSRENDDLIAENKSLVSENESLFADNKRLQSLVTSQRSEIDTLKQKLGL